MHSLVAVCCHSVGRNWSKRGPLRADADRAARVQLHAAKADATAAGAALQVQEPVDLACALHEIFDEKLHQVTMGAAAAAFASCRRGATTRTVDVVQALVCDV